MSIIFNLVSITKLSSFLVFVVGFPEFPALFSVKNNNNLNKILGGFLVQKVGIFTRKTPKWRFSDFFLKLPLDAGVDPGFTPVVNIVNMAPISLSDLNAPPGAKLMKKNT